MKRNRRIIAESSMWEVDKHLRKVYNLPSSDGVMDYFNIEGKCMVKGEFPRDMKIIDIYGRKRKITKKYVPFDWQGKGTSKFS